MKKIIILALCVPFFSGCMLNWAFESDEYRAQLQTHATEINAISSALSNEINTSSLENKENLQTETMKKLLQQLHQKRQTLEQMPVLRGDDSYKQSMIAWVDALIVFFEQDIVLFLSAPKNANSSDELQGAMQKMYESSKKIKETKKRVEEKIEALP